MGLPETRRPIGPQHQHLLQHVSDSLASFSFSPAAKLRPHVHPAATWATLNGRKCFCPVHVTDSLWSRGWHFQGASALLPQTRCGKAAHELGGPIGKWFEVAPLLWTGRGALARRRFGEVVLWQGGPLEQRRDKLIARPATRTGHLEANGAAHAQTNARLALHLKVCPFSSSVCSSLFHFLFLFAPS